MADDLTWMDLREPYQRLQWARRRSKFETAREAAASLGMNEATYSAYERRPGASKSIPLSHQRAIEFGRKFKVRWEWLLTGGGSPFPDKAGSEGADVASKIEKLPKADRDTVIQLVNSLSRRATR